MQAYLAVLASLALFGRPSLSGRAYGHASWILVLVWSAYIYRDVYPLATFDKTPADIADGPYLYAKFTLLTIAAVVVPLFVPRKYVPFNTKVCSSRYMRLGRDGSDGSLQEVLEPSPEQTSSLASLISFTFIAPVIWSAWKVPHFKYESLPPLPDYDHLRNLSLRSFPVSVSWPILWDVLAHVIHFIVSTLCRTSRAGISVSRFSVSFVSVVIPHRCLALLSMDNTKGASS